MWSLYEYLTSFFVSQTPSQILCRRCAKTVDPNNSVGVQNDEVLHLYHIDCYTYFLCNELLLFKQVIFKDGEITSTKCFNN